MHGLSDPHKTSSTEPHGPNSLSRPPPLFLREMKAPIITLIAAPPIKDVGWTPLMFYPAYPNRLVNLRVWPARYVIVLRPL